MVFFLKLIRERRENIAPSSLRQLEEIALELLHVTTAAEPCFPATHLLNKIIASNYPSFIAGIVVRLGMPQWTRIFVDAYFKLKRNVAKNSKFDSKRPFDENSFQRMQNAAILWLNSLENREEFIKEMATEVPRLVEDFRDFGLIESYALQRVVSENLAFESINSSSVTSVSVELIDHVTLLFGKLEKPLSLPPIQTISEKKDLPAIQKMTQKTLDLLDAADTVSKLGRNTSYFSEFLIATHMCFFLYSSAVCALTEIIQWYEMTGSAPQNDLNKEKQIAEENRVETLVALKLFGSVLVDEPIAQLGTEIVQRCISSDGMRVEKPIAIDILKSLQQGTVRIPTYPDKVQAMWSDILVELDLPQMLDLRLFSIDLRYSLDKLCNSLRKCGYKKLPHYFLDREFVEIAGSMVKKWGAY